MNLQLLKIKDDTFLHWKEDLIKVKKNKNGYSEYYGNAPYILENDLEFTYDHFKHLSDDLFPNDFYVSSYCKIKAYKPVWMLSIWKINDSVTYRLYASYDLHRWKEDINLEKFCTKLWEAFTLAGLQTEEKPILKDEYSYNINITTSFDISKTIEEAVRDICHLMNEIHLSVFKKLCIPVQNSISKLPLESNGDTGKYLKITKYRGKFFEIDIPRILDKIFNKKA